MLDDRPRLPIMAACSLLVGTAVTRRRQATIRFANLGPGTYVVREEHCRSGWTTEHSESRHYRDGSPAGPTSPAGRTIGDFQLISISGTKFQGYERQRRRDPGEPPVWQGSLRTIDLLRARVAYLLWWGPPSPATTNGNYTFANLGPGTYVVREVVPARLD